jgi:hypothetical protein
VTHFSGKWLTRTPEGDCERETGMLDSMVKAHQAIGEYFCAFSSLERELGQAIKVVLRLQGNAAADAIVSLIGDFARKAGVVREAVQTAKRADGTDPDENWKSNADQIMGEIYGCNSPDRIDLAHSYLEPHPDGSLSLQRPGKSPKLWTSTDLGDKIAKLNELTIKLNAVTTDLTTLTIPVPSGWISMDAYQPRARQFPPSDLGTGSTQPPPLTLRDAEQKKQD